MENPLERVKSRCEAWKILVRTEVTGTGAQDSPEGLLWTGPCCRSVAFSGELS